MAAYEIFIWGYSPGGLSGGRKSPVESRGESPVGVAEAVCSQF